MPIATWMPTQLKFTIINRDPVLEYFYIIINGNSVISNLKIFFLQSHPSLSGETVIVNKGFKSYKYLKC